VRRRRAAAHGLRKTAAIELAKAVATTHEILRSPAMPRRPKRSVTLGASGKRRWKNLRRQSAGPRERMA